MAEANKTICDKLRMVQQKLKAPKNQYNSYGKYRYRSCEDILEGVKPLYVLIRGLYHTAKDNKRQQRTVDTCNMWW